jgi:prepilin-type N-terminal cleavage/methylation domain-containing protein
MLMRLTLIKLVFTYKNARKNSGFTLIELIVVMIIIGTLTAIALPNFINQVGKAREMEGTNAIGNINRSQQAYHFEKQNFSSALNNNQLSSQNDLGITINSRYYSFSTSAGDDTKTTVTATPLQGTQDGIRSYAGAVGFNTTGSQYNTLICQGNSVASGSITVTAAVNPNCPLNSVPLQ